MAGVHNMNSAHRKGTPFALGALAALTFLVVAYSNAYADRAEARYLVEEGARLEKMGQPDNALDRYEKAIAADPDYVLAYEAAAPHWLRKGATADVIRHFERLTLRKPEYAFGWYTLAYAYRLTGRLDHAVLAYQSCIHLRPKEADPYFGLAMVHKRAGRNAEAIAAFRTYIKLERDPAKAEYVAQAKQEIIGLGGTPPEEAPAPPATTAPATTSTPAAPISAPTPSNAAPTQAAPARAQAAPADSAPAPERASPSGVQPALAQADALIEDHRYASAEALLGRVQPSSPAERTEVILLRARIALGRGDATKARELLQAAKSQAPAPYDRRIDALLGTLPKAQK